MSFKPKALRRHAFVRLPEGAWEQARSDGGDIATLRGWLEADRPLIVRRPCLSDDGREAFLGLALPGKIRMGYRVPIEQVRFVEQPPLWEEAPAIFEGRTVRLFGSHAWQALTGLAYVTENSDIDVLLEIHCLEEWEKFLEQRLTLPSSPKIDLEIVLKGDASFNWMEYVGPAADILIKSNRRVWLERKDRLKTLLE